MYDRVFCVLKMDLFTLYASVKTNLKLTKTTSVKYEGFKSLALRTIVIYNELWLPNKRRYNSSCQWLDFWTYALQLSI